MNRSNEVLYREHEVIINAIATAFDLKDLIGKHDERYEQHLRTLISFFRNYADGYHHHKEEIILFPLMAKRNELLQEGVIKEMFDNHDDFRLMTGAIERELDNKNYAAAQARLKAYGEALLDHIAVENDEVFQMAESLFSDGEAQDIDFRYQDCDRDLGNKAKEDWEATIADIRKSLAMMD